MQCVCTIWTTISRQFRREANGLSLNWSRFALILDKSKWEDFGSGSVLTFTKMRESKIKSPGLVAYPKILNPESKVNTIYFATDCRMFSQMN